MMIWKKTKTSGMLLCLALCAACSSDNDDPVVVQPPVTSYPLTIEVSENPLIPDGQEARGETRATITTTTTLTAFNLWYVYGGTWSGENPMTVTKNSKGEWTTSASWPSDAVETDVEVTWYASTAGTFKNEVDPYIDFTVEADAADQKDLLVAKTSGKYSDYYPNGENVKSLSFTFDHACTALKFYVKKAKNLEDYTLKVSNIKLKNVVNSGKYNYGSGEWTFDTNSDFTLLSTETTLSSDSYTLLNGDEENSYLFMIPQELTAWSPEQALSDCYLEIVCEIIKDGNTVYSGTPYIPAYIPFSAAFVKGYQHDVKINIGKNTLYSGQNTKIFN